MLPFLIERLLEGQSGFWLLSLLVQSSGLHRILERVAGRLQSLLHLLHRVRTLLGESEFHVLVQFRHLRVHIGEIVLQRGSGFLSCLNLGSRSTDLRQTVDFFIRLFDLLGECICCHGQCVDSVLDRLEPSGLE